MAYRRRRLLGLALVAIGVMMFASQVSGRIFGGSGRDWDDGPVQAEARFQGAEDFGEEFGDDFEGPFSEERALPVVPQAPRAPEVRVPRAPSPPEIPLRRGFHVSDDDGWHGPGRFFVLPLLLGALMVFMVARRRRRPTLYRF